LGNLDALLIQARLHTILQRQTPAGLQRNLEVELPESSTVGDLIRHLDLVIDPAELLIAVNGRLADEEQALNAGDVVDLIPAISGG